MTEGEAIADELRGLPVGAARLIRHAKGRLKDEPVEFIGREDELARYEYAVRNAIAADDDKRPDGKTVSGGTGLTITAAPGAGKTTVVRRLAERLRKDNIAVALIHASKLESPATLAEALKGQPPWSRQDWWQRLGVDAAHGLSVATDAAVQGGIGYAALQAGLPPEAPDLGIAKNLAKAWLNTPNPVIESTLRMLDIASANGTVLIIDEAQLVHDIAAGSDIGHRCVTHVINALATPAGRFDAGVARTTIILTGLSDTRRMVKQTGSWGLEPEILPPLPSHHVRELIRRGIRRGCDGDAQRAAPAEREWIGPLAEEFGDWTRHAQAASYASELILRECGQGAIDGNGLYATALLAEKFRNSAYGNVIDTAEDDGVTREMIELVGHALHRNGNRISEAAMAELIKGGVNAGWQQLMNLEIAVLATTHRLLRSGIIDRTAEISTITPAGYYYGPIPSMNHAITRDRPELNDAERTILLGAGLSIELPNSGQKPFQPDWPKLHDTNAEIKRALAHNPRLASFRQSETQDTAPDDAGEDPDKNEE